VVILVLLLLLHFAAECCSSDRFCDCSSLTIVETARWIQEQVNPEGVMSPISQVLSRKGGSVLAIDADATLHSAAQMMDRHGVGSLAVRSAGAIIGILSERDLVLQLARGAGAVVATTVRDAMHELHEIDWDDDVHYAMTLMTNRQVRHLLVRRQGALAGIVSIGDLVKATIAEQEDAIASLHQYITGQPD